MRFTTIVVSLFLISLMWGCAEEGGKLTDRQYLDRARVQVDKGALREATIELKNALSVNPKNKEARWLLGTTYLDLGENAFAEKELRYARELGVNDASVLPLLSRAFLRQGK